MEFCRGLELWRGVITPIINHTLTHALDIDDDDGDDDYYYS